ncbi:MAG: copper-binding protein [Deltaproteobacteria bacterium]|jgi:Cu/Ag efflux protein CusF|nr:copper-binding protein [Deltaproteobacteria bacterium]
MTLKIPVFRLASPGRRLGALGLALTLLVVPAWPGLTQDSERREMPFPQAPGPLTPPVKASILKVEGLALEIKVGQARLLVKCDPLKAVGWPMRILDLPVTDRALLKKIKKGDRIKFEVRFAGPKFEIVDIEKIKAQPLPKNLEKP